MRDSISREEFSNSVNSRFRLKLDESSSLDVELVTFEDLGSDARQEQFSLVFRGPAQPVLPQTIYQLEHEGIGLFNIFLVPVGRDNLGAYYEAIFNRFPEQEH